MDHRKIYNEIIQKAKNEKRQIFPRGHKNFITYENHHILPRCLGGLDTKENLVLLTLKEHFVCHKLLTYIYPKSPGIVLAFKFMSSLLLRYNISSRDFAYAKELYRSIPASEKTKEKRLAVWFELNCNTVAMDNYIESLNEVRCGQADLRIIHIPFKKA